MAVRDNPDDEMEVTFMKEMIFGAAFMICGLLLCLIMAVIYTISSSLNLLGHIIIWAGISLKNINSNSTSKKAHKNKPPESD